MPVVPTRLNAAHPPGPTGASHQGDTMGHYAM